MQVTLVVLALCAAALAFPQQQSYTQQQYEQQRAYHQAQLRDYYQRYPQARTQQFDQAGNPIAILSKSDRADPAGGYESSFTAENGIRSEEQGFLKSNADGTDVVLAKQGRFSYPLPDGTEAVITYIADELGYRPQGNIIPVGPAAV